MVRPMRYRAPSLLVAAIFVVALPILEVGPTHLFHPAWPGHARLHEAWQLLANASLGLACVWMAFRRGETFLANAVGLCAVAPFLLAAVSMGSYGGTLAHTDGQELAPASTIAVPVMALLTLWLAWALWDERSRGHALR